MRFRAILQSTAKKAFPAVGTAHLWGDHATTPLCFSHFRDVATLDSPAYGLVEDIDALRNCFERVLRDYNEFHPAMDLVLFRERCLTRGANHANHISARGHILLVGGWKWQAKSCAPIYSHMWPCVRTYATSSYGLGDFRLDLQSMLTVLAQNRRASSFIHRLSDNRQSLVYLNDLLAGSIPDLFSKDERDNLASMVEGKAKQRASPQTLHHVGSIS